MGQRPVRVGMIAAAALLMGAAPPLPPPSSTEPPADRPAPIHADGAALERAVADAATAFLRSDQRVTREALDRIEAGCRRLGRDDAQGRFKDVVVYDEAFHKTLDLAREFSASGEIDKSFDQFVWVQKTCRTCHALARKAKPAGEPARPPAPGPSDPPAGFSSSSPGGSGSPSRPSGSKPWR
jgi:hypothetical protein